jgi:hypothetical protein
MKQTDVEKLADELAVLAQNNMRADKHLMPVAFFVDEAGSFDIVAMPWPSYEAKHAAFAAVSDTARKLSVAALISITDAYYIPEPEEGEAFHYYDHRPPNSMKDDPRAKECINVAIMGPTIQEKLRMYPYARVEGQIVFGEPEPWSKGVAWLIPPWWKTREGEGDGREQTAR